MIKSITDLTPEQKARLREEEAKHLEVIASWGVEQQKIQMDIFTPTMTPDFLMYLGWHDLRTTQEKLINERKAFTQRWFQLTENLQRLISAHDFPNKFYGIGVEDALLTAGRNPLELIPPLHEYSVVVPWTVPNFNQVGQPPSTDTCMVCKKEGSYFLYVEEGPAHDYVICSENCLNQALRFYINEDNMIHAWVSGKVERPVVTLDLRLDKLQELFSKLPSRANLRKQGDGLSIKSSGNLVEED